MLLCHAAASAVEPGSGLCICHLSPFAVAAGRCQEWRCCDASDLGAVCGGAWVHAVHRGPLALGGAGLGESSPTALCSPHCDPRVRLIDILALLTGWVTWQVTPVPLTSICPVGGGEASSPPYGLLKCRAFVTVSAPGLAETELDPCRPVSSDFCPLLFYSLSPHLWKTEPEG